MPPVQHHSGSPRPSLPIPRPITPSSKIRPEISDKRLDTRNIVVTSAAAQLSFRNNFTLQDAFDGGVLEVSSPNIAGGAFTDITNPAVGGSFVTGGYTDTLERRAAATRWRAAWRGRAIRAATSTPWRISGRTCTDKRSSCGSAWEPIRPSKLGPGASIPSQSSGGLSLASPSRPRARARRRTPFRGSAILLRYPDSAALHPGNFRTPVLRANESSTSTSTSAARALAA